MQYPPKPMNYEHAGTALKGPSLIEATEELLCRVDSLASFVESLSTRIIGPEPEASGGAMPPLAHGGADMWMRRIRENTDRLARAQKYLEQIDAKIGM